MLNERGIAHTYREYTADPLGLDEIRAVFAKLGMRPVEMLRKRDKAYKELGLTGTESDDVLMAHMPEHPTLLQRPIGISGDRAVSGRPIENLLELVGA